jgi:phosphatidate cytidylyltransferase
VIRVLSGAALILLVASAVWFAPFLVMVAVAGVFLAAAVWEVVNLARAVGIHVPLLLPMTGALTVLATFALPETPTANASPGVALGVVLMAQTVATLGAGMGSWVPGDRNVLAGVAAGLFPSLYAALPLGALVSIRASEGAAVVFLLMLTVIVSDTAQYYTGRLVGRSPLAPTISPKKTKEGAAGGIVFGTVFFVVAGAWWLGRVPVPLRVLVGLTIVVAGIAGDLFESMLKRSAGVKDSSSIIPGHGGVLDRIDALLFAAPVFYALLQYM